MKKLKLALSTLFLLLFFVTNVANAFICDNMSNFKIEQSNSDDCHSDSSKNTKSNSDDCTCKSCCNLVFSDLSQFNYKTEKLYSTVQYEKTSILNVFYPLLDPPINS